MFWLIIYTTKRVSTKWYIAPTLTCIVLFSSQEYATT